MRKAFTLMEILVVVVIIAVLTALLLPALGDARKQSGRIACGSNLRMVSLAFDAYRNDHSDIYPCADDPLYYATDSQKWIWLWMGRGWRDVLGPWIAPGLSADNPNVVWCPSDITPRDNFTNTSYSYSMAFYHSPDQINEMTDATYMYGNTPGKVRPGRAISSTQVTWPDRKILAGEWFSNHKLITGNINTEPGWWSRRGTRNYVFADGHVEFVPAERIRPANDNCSNPGLTVNGVNGSDL